MMVLLAVFFLGYTTGFRLRQGYLREALDHLHSLRLLYFLGDIICFTSLKMWNHFLLLDLLTFVLRNFGRLWTYMVQIYQLARLQQQWRRSRSHIYIYIYIYIGIHRTLHHNPTHFWHFKWWSHKIDHKLLDQAYHVTACVVEERLNSVNSSSAE